MFAFRIWLVMFLVVLCSGAQEPPSDLTRRQPRLFLREDWKPISAATPITQEHVANLSLLLALYGPGRNGIKKSHHDQPADDPYYVWSGTCRGNWAVTLRDEHAWADLTGPAKIRWRTKQSGFRELHIILKLSNGTWLVSDQADGESLDWRVWERNVANLRWRRLDIGAIVEGAKVERPDLSRVDEIGWTDLMSGGGSAACSRLDWIEVYAKHVARPTRLPQAKETR